MTRATGFISCFKRITQHSNIFDFENWLQNCKNFIALCRDGMQGVVKLHVGLQKYCSSTCRHGAPWIAGSHLPACWIFAPGHPPAPARHHCIQRSDILQNNCTLFCHDQIKKQAVCGYGMSDDVNLASWHREMLSQCYERQPS